MKNRYEIELEAVENAMGEHVDGYKAIYSKATEENRDPNQDERLEIEKHLRDIEVLKGQRTAAQENIATLKHVDDLGKELGKGMLSGGPSVTSEPQDRLFQNINKSLGGEFTSSKGYKDAIEEYKSRGGSFRQGFAIPDVAMKGTLLEGAGGGGGALASTVPQVIPGVVGKLFQELTFADLLLSGQATTSSIRYVIEGTATSGAAGVAEGALKPESTLGLTTADEPIKKIATVLPVSEEMLEDAPAIEAYINGRLSLFVKIEEERQLIRGTSGGNEVQGLLTSRSVPVYAGGTAAGNKAVQLFKAMNGMRGSAFVEPEWIVMNPSDWQDIRLATDTAGQFFGGGPFQGPYGNGQNVQATGQIAGQNDAVWGKAVYVTGAIGAGTAIVGSRAAAQVWRRGGLSVDASNSHSDYFQRNLVALRAETRLGMCVYRPAGFVEVRVS